MTEVGHHDKDTVVAEVEFLALSEWKAELEILLDDLVGEDGRPKRSTDLRNDAGVAWHKVVIPFSCQIKPIVLNLRFRCMRCTLI